MNMNTEKQQRMVLYAIQCKVDQLENRRNHGHSSKNETKQAFGSIIAELMQYFSEEEIPLLTERDQYVQLLTHTIEFVRNSTSTGIGTSFEKGNGLCAQMSEALARFICCYLPGLYPHTRCCSIAKFLCEIIWCFNANGSLRGKALGSMHNKVFAHIIIDIMSLFKPDDKGTHVVTTYTSRNRIFTCGSGCCMYDTQLLHAKISPPVKDWVPKGHTRGRYVDELVKIFDHYIKIIDRREPDCPPPNDVVNDSCVQHCQFRQTKSHSAKCVRVNCYRTCPTARPGKNTSKNTAEKHSPLCSRLHKR
jgi:hypothetical protein